MTADAVPAAALPRYPDVVAAAARLAGVAHRTPVLRSRLLDARTGAEVHFKCENFQRMGAFKFRGAYHALSRFDADQRAAGVVAYSSGNHAQAVALAARLLGIEATIVMPEDAPESKLAATRGYGGEVVLYDRYAGDPAPIAADLAARRGLVFVPPFDHPDIIAGAGTAALELFEETGPLDALFVPLGGGGLLSGTGLVAREIAPGCALFGVEPEAGDDGRQSLARGEIVTIDPPRTLADGAQTLALGKLTFPLVREAVTDILAVPDDALAPCLRDVATYLKIVVEPTAVLGLAALYAEAERWRGKRVGVLVTGGNVDLERYAGLLAGTRTS
ncbi:threo-3-hydroxy-L-aspartate ammonia-lyase [Streptomyces sp. DSM 41982]|uniref:threonine ammonia-lyase n=1 Tax=Streptomyces evansiae TaxID=3075535 RepID=A0ABD5E4I8_9ACTN|nr:MULTISPECIES: threo-3-hydroxy-L-aspartate ammonia-lyase [unclassified Streptomyces]MDT0415532.1 threo-3-hydroxy-L-aspartate ammonia-lyase [Streptomyces sp. DSM 41982]SCE35020.1 threonine dehydratase [Streptomyces sp. SolWspMP-sol7th]